MSDEDDIPSRANVPKLSAHPTLQQKNDEDDDAYPDAERIKSLLNSPAFQQDQPDIAKEHIAFLDNAIILAAPPDLLAIRKMLTRGLICKVQLLGTN